MHVSLADEEPQRSRPKTVIVSALLLILGVVSVISLLRGSNLLPVYRIFGPKIRGEVRIHHAWRLNSASNPRHLYSPLSSMLVGPYMPYMRKMTKVPNTSLKPKLLLKHPMQPCLLQLQQLLRQLQQHLLQLHRHARSE